MKVSKNLTRIVLVSAILLMTAANCLALGKWDKGKVTQKPWRNKNVYIKIDNVKYKIMKEAEIIKVYTENDSQYQTPIKRSDLQVGDTLLFTVEGNRIYSIQQMK